MSVVNWIGIACTIVALVYMVFAFGWVNVKWFDAPRVKGLKLIPIALLSAGLILLLKNDQREQVITSSRMKESRTFVRPRAIGWDEVKKAILKKQCLEQAKNTSEKYPKIAEDYCECSTEKIIQEIAYENYQLLLYEPQQKQFEFLAPILEPCIEIMMSLIKLEEDAAKQRNATSGNAQ